MEIFLASNFGSDHKIMAVVEKEKMEEVKVAKVEKAEKVVVVAACNNHIIRDIVSIHLYCLLRGFAPAVL